MLEPFIEGRNRVVYQATAFQSGLTVTACFWNPFLEKGPPQQFEELSDGLYYLDFDFSHEGTWIGLFFEDGEKKTSQVYKVTTFVGDADNVAGIIVHKGNET